ncbi:RidA family protein [Novosphingobium resinovorum]|uniref:RidA family protein n=1 Tax=Novosphingobium resinovorum TaxID=158500 RepID=UPI002ED19DD8|nr:Rid family hydrolase [Novosphingobium resinovorum]
MSKPGIIEAVTTDKAFCPPKEIPISQAIRANGFIFLMGVGPRDAATGRMVGDEIREQTHQTIRNVKAILEAAGAGLEHVVRCTSLITDREQFDGFNAVFDEYFADIRPARSTFVISGFRPVDMLMELEVTAVDPNWKG